MKKEYTAEYQGGTRTLYSFAEPNAKGERIQFELTACHNPGGKDSLPYLWKKHKFIDRVLETWWTARTMVRTKRAEIMQILTA